MENLGVAGVSWSFSGFVLFWFGGGGDEGKNRGKGEEQWMGNWEEEKRTRKERMGRIARNSFGSHTRKIGN